tara:strand:- start:6114 stop:6536 length:423 start_codon:yes stop_codon:yes gene_type:complete
MAMPLNVTPNRLDQLRNGPQGGPPVGPQGGPPGGPPGVPQGGPPVVPQGGPPVVPQGGPQGGPPVVPQGGPPVVPPVDRLTEMGAELNPEITEDSLPDFENISGVDVAPELVTTTVELMGAEQALIAFEEAAALLRSNMS